MEQVTTDRRQHEVSSQAPDNVAAELEGVSAEPLYFNQQHDLPLEETDA